MIKIKSFIHDNRITIVRCIKAVAYCVLAPTVYTVVLYEIIKVLPFLTQNQVKENAYSVIYPFFFSFCVLKKMIDLLRFPLRGYREISEMPKATIKKVTSKEQIVLNECNEIKAYHEAGHAVIANELGFTVGKVSIQTNGASGGCIELLMPEICKSLQIKNHIKVLYAGYASEVHFLGEGSNGFCGTLLNSDQKYSNEFLKQYILLTNPELSITGYEEDQIKSEMINLSKELLQDVKSLVNEHSDKIKALAVELLSGSGELLFDDYKERVLKNVPM